MLPEGLIEETRKKQHIPGMAVAIIRDRELFTANFGIANAVYRILVTDQTLFGVGALTQIVTASSILQLRDAGKLHLDDPIKKFLPDFDISSQFLRTPPLTIRHLLAHVSGIPNELFKPHIQTGKMLSSKEIRRQLRKLELCFPVGTATLDSTLGYALLGHVIECVSNERYQNYALDKVIRPAGMLRSGFDFFPPMRGRALGYTINAGHALISNSYITNGFVSGCGLFATAYDIAQLVYSLFGLSVDQEVLSESSLREMQMPAYIAPDWNGVALGWKVKRVASESVLYQEGTGYGFSACILAIPSQRRGIIILTNGCPLDTNWKPLELAEKMLALPFLASSASSVSSTGQMIVGQQTGRFQSHLTSQFNWKEYEGQYTLLQQSYQVEVITGTRNLLVHGVNHRMILIPVPNYFHLFDIQGDVLNGDRASFLVEKGKFTELHLGDLILKRNDGLE